MLIIAGPIQLAPNRRDAFLAASREVVVAARDAPGCLDFTIAADPLDPDRVNVFERWTSEAELLAFRGDGPSDDSMSDVVAGNVQRYEIAGVGPA